MTLRDASRSSPSVLSWRLTLTNRRCSCAMPSTKWRVLRETSWEWTSPSSSSNRCSANSPNAPMVTPCLPRHWLTLARPPSLLAVSTRLLASILKMPLIMFIKGKSLMCVDVNWWLLIWFSQCMKQNEYRLVNVSQLFRGFDLFHMFVNQFSDQCF